MPYLVDGARRWGCLDPIAPDGYTRARLDPAVGAAIAAAYMAAPVRDPRAGAAYAAFRRETIRQYAYLVGRAEFGGLGVTVRIMDTDPYADAAAMIDDLVHRELKVFATAATDNPHPVLSNAENDMFRAVHDAFGHASIGRGFDGHGEEAAWLKHRSMYSPLAGRALATETRGQNCAMIFHYRGQRFAEQKAALLPRAFSDPRAVRLDRSAQRSDRSSPP
ncbi:hypothetical protein [Actinoplanes lobatus]|uniref:Uncharacterized protein n=1 Tax=Actinoplanes lobatus TaxID=113568 RepID=A0A7W7HL38_9ACTN|nr:hypothetical protein [Actinoplanes lobatus]MBB4752519.1 hypothetical protein [Actinoplanes lobatus]